MVRSHPSEAERIRKFCCWKTHWNWKQIKTRKASYGFLRRMAKCEKEKVFPHHFSWWLSAKAIVLAWVENPMIPQGGRQQKLIRIYLSSFPFRFACLRLPLAVSHQLRRLKDKAEKLKKFMILLQVLISFKIPGLKLSQRALCEPPSSHFCSSERLNLRAENKNKLNSTPICFGVRLLFSPSTRCCREVSTSKSIQLWIFPRIRNVHNSRRKIIIYGEEKKQATKNYNKKLSWNVFKEQKINETKGKHSLKLLP